MPRETHTADMTEPRHPATPPENATRFEEGQRITWVSVVVNIVLTAMQLVVGFIAHSQSLIADAMHTLSDILADAFVLFANRKDRYGRMIEIDHGNGLSTRYGHLSEINVKVGDLIKIGQVIGAVGSTGRSTGPHLHYETRVDGDPVDPQKFLRAGVRLSSG